MVRLVIFLFAVGCSGAGLYADEAETQGAKDLQCPKTEVHACLTSTHKGTETYCVSGCGGQKGYDCDGIACIDDPFGCSVTC